MAGIETHQLLWLYILTMLGMSIIQPIVGIISQVFAVLIIQKVQKWWAARKTKVEHEVHPVEARIVEPVP